MWMLLLAWPVLSVALGVIVGRAIQRGQAAAPVRSTEREMRSFQGSLS